MTEEEFKDLFRALHPRLTGYVARQVGTQASADVVAETFTIAWEKRSRAPSSADERAAWIFGIAKNKIQQARQYRARKHHDHRYVSDYPGAQVAERDASAVVDERLFAHWIYRHLTAGEQQLLDTATIPGMTAAGAAQVLGITIGAYATRLSRLRARLSQLRSIHAEPRRETP